MNVDKNLKRLISLASLAVLANCTAISANAAPADETIVLTQKCKAIGGNYTVYVCKDKVRVESAAAIVFSEGPKWEISVLNPKKKIYIRAEYKTGLKRIQAARVAFSTIADAATVKWRKIQGEKIVGLPTEQWSNQSTNSAHTSSVKYWTLSQPQFAPQCAEIMAACFGTPNIGKGLPMRFDYTGTGDSLMPILGRQRDEETSRQQEFHWLDTAAMKKIVPQASLFAVPTGFKATTNYAEIAVSGDTKSVDTKFIIKDLMNNPDALFNAR